MDSRSNTNLAWLALAVVVLLTVAGAAQADPAAATPIRTGTRYSVNAKLLAKAPTPTLEQIAPYTEALAVYKYRIERQWGRKIKHEVIAVTHRVIYRNLTQPVAGKRIGQTIKLSLRPYEDVARSVQTVYRSELDGAHDLPLYHDVGQQLQLPPQERARWNYGVDLSEMMPIFLACKDQISLVALGDCQAWFANKAPLYMAEQNRDTPVALSLCQQRSGLPFQKLLVDNYLVRLPRLEWVILTWNPRFVNADWGEHGVQAERFRSSPGFAHDRKHTDEVWAPREGKPLSVEDIGREPRFAPIWAKRPWGWIYLSPDRHRFPAKGEVRRAQEKLGAYKFVPERWELFEAIVETLAKRDIRLLVYTTPVHGETVNHRVKDKSGVDSTAYRDQVTRMQALEKKYPRTMFFHDLNNMGDHGLVDEDFENIDHVSASGAQKVTERVEAWRLEIDAWLNGRREERPEPAPGCVAPTPSN